MTVWAQVLKKDNQLDNEITAEEGHSFAAVIFYLNRT